MFLKSYNSQAKGALKIESKQTGYLVSSTPESPKKGLNGRSPINLYRTRQMSYASKRSERRHYSTRRCPPSPRVLAKEQRILKDQVFFRKVNSSDRFFIFIK